MLKLTQEGSPTKGAKVHKAWIEKSSKSPPRKLTSDEALASIIRNRKTVASYKDDRLTLRDVGHDVYPNYHDVLVSKKRCYPAEMFISVSDSTAEVEFSQLIHHTFNRICKVQAEVINNLNLDSIDHFRCEVKVGSDGTSGMSAYKMTSSVPLDERNIYLTTLVPLSLKAYHTNGQLVLGWKNPKQSSTRFCRPVKFQFVCESKDVTLQEIKRLKVCFQNVPDLSVEIDELRVPIKIKFQQSNFYYTMIDGKVANVLTETSSNAVCRFCKSTPKIMNDIENVVLRTIHKEALEFGISPMHARIRCLDLVLHVSYRDINGLRCQHVKMTEN